MLNSPSIAIPYLKMTAHLFETDAGNVLVIPMVWPPMEPLSDAVEHTRNAVSKFYNFIDFVVTGRQTVFIFTGDEQRLVSASIHADGPWSLLCKLPVQPRSSPASAVQPQEPCEDPQAFRRRFPLYDAVLKNISGNAPELLDYISNQCFYGKLLTKSFFGNGLSDR